MRPLRFFAVFLLASGFVRAQVIPTPTWTDFYSDASTANGVALPVGSVVQAYDPQGVLCGEFISQIEGSYGYLHVYGDDPTTSGIDEGAEVGDTIRFRIQGIDAIGFGIWVGGRAIVEVHLHASLPPPAAPILTLPLDGASEVNRPALFKWSIPVGTYPPVGVTTSRLQMAKDSLFVETVMDSSGIPGTTLSVTGLQGGRIYYWRVRIENSVSGEGEFSPVFDCSTSVTALLELSAITVGFAPTAVGDTASRTLVVRNLSEDSVIVSLIATGSSVFGVSPSSRVLSGLESLVVRVTYTPDSFGGHSDTVSVHSDASTPLLKAHLSGSSPQPMLVVHPMIVDFGPVPQKERDSVAVFLSSSTVNRIRVDSLRTSTSYFIPRVSGLPRQSSGSDSILAWVIFAPDTNRYYADTLVAAGAVVAGGSAVTVRIPLTGTGVIVSGTGNIVSAPADFQLDQNYPNPFNPTTTISYAVAVRSRVKITVYSILGQQTGDIVNRIDEAGLHSVTFDAQSMPSGMYFYTIRVYSIATGSEVFGATRRMVLLR